MDAVFIYGKGTVTTGQQRASELAIQGLRARGWRVREIATPLLDRTGRATGGHLVSLAARLATSWVRGLVCVFGPHPVCLNLGQTRFALVRDGFPLLTGGVLARSRRAVVSLHGSVFAQWALDSLEARLLRGIVSAAAHVTVTGQGQREQLVRLGIPRDKVVWLDNSCDLAPVSDGDCLRKHAETRTGPLRILYLSNLLESKGYPEFVRAISHLARSTDLWLEATLCGPLLRMDDDALFPSVEEASQWVRACADGINATSHAVLRRISGAYGAAKMALFRESHVFVLPSHLEAQPLTILEALASGCTVVTTRVGEIPSTVSEETAVFLDDTNPETIAQAIAGLYRDPERRTRLALNGLALFRERFSYERHIDRWEQILMELADRGR
jgi:glycosyltransferase involved in cell wall biosynthesis